jgi:hypothetical protein
LERFKVALIVPAFNEEGTIINVVKNILPYGVPIVVNDHSNDSTSKVEKIFRRKIIYHYSNKKNGYEKSIQMGFDIAYKKKFSHVITFDADNQHNPKDLIKVIEFFKKNYYLVVGERKILSRFSEKLFSILFKKFVGLKDPLSGLKGYNLKVFIKNKNIFDSFSLAGTELLIKSYINNYKIAKFSILTRKRTGNSRFGNILIGNFKIYKALILSIVILVINKFKINSN